MAYELALLAMTLVLSGVYATVGWTVLRRRPGGAGRLAATSFGAWWMLLAVANLSRPVDAAVRVAGEWSLPAFVAWTQMVLLVIVAALGFLMYYLVYLFTGRRLAWLPVALAYVVYFGAILWYIAYAGPVGLDETSGRTALEYARDMDGHWATLVLGILLVAPPLVGAIGYASLLLRVQGRTQRFRIAMISGAFILWFATTLAVGQATDLGQRAWWPAASTLLAVAASLAVLAAFRPPHWLRRRLGVEGFGEAS